MLGGKLCSVHLHLGYNSEESQSEISLLCCDRLFSLRNFIALSTGGSLKNSGYVTRSGTYFSLCQSSDVMCLIYCSHLTFLLSEEVKFLLVNSLLIVRSATGELLAQSFSIISSVIILDQFVSDV